MTRGGEADATALAARIDAYCACWRLMPQDERRSALARELAEDVRYCDPTVDLHGLAALSAHIGEVCAARPEAVVARTTAVDLHHGQARFGWEMHDGQKVFLAGSIDVIEWCPTSRLITRITGFFGPLTPADSAGWRAFPFRQGLLRVRRH